MSVFISFLFKKRIFKKVMTFLICGFAVTIFFAVHSVASAQEYDYQWGITEWLSNNPNFYEGVLDSYNTQYKPPQYDISGHGLEFNSGNSPLDPLRTPYSYDTAIGDPNAFARDANGTRIQGGWYLTSGSQRKWDTAGINGSVYQGWEYSKPGWLSNNGIVNHYQRYASYLYQIPKPTYTGCSIGGYQYQDGSGRYWYNMGRTVQLNATANDVEGWVRQFRLSILDGGGQGITGFMDFTNWYGSCDGRNGSLFSSLDIEPSSDSGQQWTREYYNAVVCGEDYYTVYAAVDNRSGVHAQDSSSINTGINIGTDGTPPTLPSINLTSGTNGGWTGSNIAFNLSGSSDNRSGLSYYQYNVDNTGWTNYGGTVTISNEGWHTIQARAIDHVGNVSGATTVYAGVDKSAPTAIITANPATPDGSNGWYKTSTAPVITFHATDGGGSGLKSVTYSATGADTKTSVATADGGTYTLPKEGTYSFTETATDNVGNVATATKTVSWDKTPPSGDPYVGWNAGNDNLYLLVSSVNDSVSGVNSVYVVLTDKDNSANKQTLQLTKSQYDNSWQLNNTDVLAMFAESYQVQADIYATDKAGNVALLKSQALDLLHISATVDHNPAKQGQQLTFTINTVGNPVKLSVDFPTAIGGTSDIQITKNKTLTTTYQYTLSLGIPLTLDPQGNKLLDPYVFTFTTTKASGKTASCIVSVDVQNNIYSGLRTRFIN